MATCNQSEFARLMGVNKSTVTRWRQAGRLVMDGRGRVLVDESQARVARSQAGRTDVAERHARNRGRNLPEAPQGPADAPEGGDDTGADAPGRTRYKARGLRYENARIKLELDLRHGYRLPRDAVQREAQGIGNVLRAAVERLIDVSAPQAAALDAPRREALLAGEARALRRILKTELARAQRRIRKEGTDA